MDPDIPLGQQFKEGKIGDDAHWQFLREQQQQRNQSKERRRSLIQNKQKINEEQKMDFQKLYKMQKKLNQELKIQIQKLRIEISANKSLYQQTLSKAEEKSYKNGVESRTKIKELTDENQLLSIMNKNNSKMLQDTIKELSQKIQLNLNLLREKEKEIKKQKQVSIELKSQITTNKKELDETIISLYKLLGSVGVKDQQIAKLKNLLASAESENSQKLRQMQINLRHYEQTVKDNEEKIVKINNQNLAIQNKLQQLIQQCQMEQHKNIEKKAEIQKLNQILEESKKNFQALPDEIDKLINLNNKVKYHHVLTNYKSPKFVLVDSMVLKDRKQLQTMYNFFQNKKVKGFKLLFRASDYGFDLKYKKKYCGVAHTVLLVKTQYGKVIGGYTPLMWKIVRNRHGYMVNGQQYQNDTSGESFIFSVSNNHKLKLESPQENKAVYHQNNQGPTFCSGIGISDQSNTKKSGALYHNKLSYVHPEYKDQNREFRMKFIGSPLYQFLTQQWQVHQVIFQEQ